MSVFARLEEGSHWEIDGVADVILAVSFIGRDLCSLLEKQLVGEHTSVVEQQEIKCNLVIFYSPAIQIDAVCEKPSSSFFSRRELAVRGRNGIRRVKLFKHGCSLHFFL